MSSRLSESDLAPWRIRRSDQLFEGVEDDTEPVVVFFLESLDFARELAVRVHQPTELYERAHDRDV